ncbi:hypothetical protein BH24ACT21_BH24ACT21_02250 [soil metagenome]
MSSQDRDYVQEIEGQMRAAEALIESLEEEVTSLRRDLEQASVALKAAQEEVAAREESLEEKERERSDAEVKAREASSTIAELRIQSSDEQLDPTNRHISELARLQDRFQDQLRTEIESALSAEDRESLKEEHRQVREAAEQRYDERLSTLEDSYREAQEKLREDKREFDRGRAAEIEEICGEAEAQKREWEQKLQQQLEQRVQEALQSTKEEHEAELESQRKSSADREQQLQRDHQTELKNQQDEFNILLTEMEDRIKEAEEQHQAKLREIKGLAENREQELRKTHAARLTEAKTEADRRIESLRAQREADNKALRTRHEEDLAQLRTQYEDRMKEAAEQSRTELWTAQEKLEGIKLERTSEATAYRGRLKELEAMRQSEKPDGETTEALTQDVHETEPPTQETVSSEATRHLQAQIEELKLALSVSESARETLARELEESREHPETEIIGPGQNGHEQQEAPEGRTGELRAEDPRTQERIRELEVRLQESQEESQRTTEELQRATENLRRLSDPEHRMRGGISAFNDSEHARHVASISKSLGLPKVHAGMDEDAVKPVFTFVWEELAWRRYVAEPAEDLHEPRVYLLGGGDDPDEIGDVEQREPNARIDARGRLILGVQAR